MRQLGAESGVEVMALYRYVMALYRYAAGEEALLEGLVGAVFAWWAELHRIARETYMVAVHHPHAGPLFATRMPAVPLARRPAAVLRDHERVLSRLRQAGLDDAAAARTRRTHTAWLLGHGFVELRAVVDDPDESDPVFRLGLHRMPAQELRRLRAASADLAEREGLKGLAAGLDALLDGCVWNGVWNGDDSSAAGGSGALR